MLTRTIVLFALILGAGAAAAQAYKWTDDNGIVHFSDRPAPGAEEIVLPGANASAPEPPRSNPGTQAAGSGSQPEPAPFAYQRFAVSVPGSEETLWNIEGVLNVALDLQPGLQPGHRIRVYFDGEPLAVTGTSFQINEVWRGAHNIQAEVLDETGRLMIRSQTSRFYVQQNRIRR